MIAWMTIHIGTSTVGTNDRGRRVMASEPGSGKTCSSEPGADITARENLEYNLRHGVKHLTAQVQGRGPGGAWDLEELKRMRANCDAHFA